ncbi:asparagine synthase (glutamine-hydrolyzing) [bacterium]|nr:asparagine synthase (glutamine-hydrolyzing) [bacterium]
MCGIAGYIGKQQLAENSVNSALETMRRRGPDHCDSIHRTTSSGLHVHLLHSRLSIIDLDPRSNQPFYRDGHWLIYNGELYNYVEVRDYLEKKGYQFRTSGDTEVLLTLWIAEGWKGLDRCEGMWAFAVYDEKKGMLHLVRDRFAEKPLHIFESSDGLYFASEIKTIKALADSSPRINFDHLTRYIINGYKSLHKTNYTFYEGITQIPAATVVAIDQHLTRRRTRYWIPEFEQNQSMGFEDAVELSRSALRRSLEIRLRSDVPLAFCMSGGIDSNSLIHLAAKEFGYDVHGFNIVNTDKRYEEQEMVDASLQALKVRHTPVFLETANFLDNLKSLINYHDSPVYTISLYVGWMLQKAIADAGYKVSISGVGADELFSGYYDHHNTYLSSIQNESDLFQKSLENWHSGVGEIVRNPYLKDPLYLVKTPLGRDHIFLNRKEFENSLKQPWSEEFSEKQYSDDLLRNRMANELFSEVVPAITHEDDLNAMYFSVENRSPFLDRGLFDVTSKIPTRHLVQNGLAKAVLRESVRGLVPDIILNSVRKVGFNAPIEMLLDRKDAEVRQRVVDSKELNEIVDRKRLEALFAKDELPNSESKLLFNLVNTALFLEEEGL